MGNNISRYIYELLLVHDCVILPDFGGFVANYRSAIINTVQQSFLPPAKEVAFNSGLTRNDGLLASYIAETEGISYTDAMSGMKKYTGEILLALENGRTVIFENIGVFRYNEEDVLQFIPEASINFLLESFGLSSFQFPAIGELKAERAVKDAYRDNEFIKNALRSAAVKRVLIGMPLIAALALIPLSTNMFRSTNINISNTSPVNATQKTIEANINDRSEYSPGDQDMVGQVIDRMTDKRNALFYQEAVKRSFGTVSKQEIMDYIDERLTTDVRGDEPAEKDQAVPEITVADDNFFLIAGSFKNKNGADKLCSQLSQKGYPAKVLEEEKGYFRVSAKSFNNRDSAVRDMNRIRSEGKLAVWLLSR